MSCSKQSDFMCDMCSNVISTHHGFKIHKDLTFLCLSCANIMVDEWPTYGQVIEEQDFIEVGPIIPCQFFTTCQQEASVRCTCMNHNLCELDLLKVHRKVPASRKCVPVILNNDNSETLCSSCNQLYSSFVNKKTQEEICTECIKKQVDNKDDYIDKDSNFKELFDLKIKKLENKIIQYQDLQKNRVKLFKDAISEQRKKQKRQLAELKKLAERSARETAFELAKMESSSTKTIILLQKLKSQNLHQVFIEAVKSKTMKPKQGLDKLQTWVKETLKLLNQSSLSSLVIETPDDPQQQKTSPLIPPSCSSSNILIHGVNFQEPTTSKPNLFNPQTTHLSCDLKKRKKEK